MTAGFRVQVLNSNHVKYELESEQRGNLTDHMFCGNRNEVTGFLDE